MHEHLECQHENLKYCKICKVVYCTECGKEWHENGWIYSYPHTYPQPSPWIITYGDNSNSFKDPNTVIGTVTCNHHA